MEYCCSSLPLLSVLLVKNCREIILLAGYFNSSFYFSFSSKDDENSEEISSLRTESLYGGTFS